VDLLPESRAALDEYFDFSQPDLTDALMGLGKAACRAVPDVVALSLHVVEDDITFMLVAAGLSGSPSADPLPSHRDAQPPPDGDPLDEQRWLGLARDSSAPGIASSISLPVLQRGQVVWQICVYASTPEAFVGRHHELARVLGAWDVGAVTNADLTFATRDDAEDAPRRLHDLRVVDVAIGLQAGRHGITVEAARLELERMATESGIPLVEAAEHIIRSRFAQ
jgi:GAF domain-containing protein